MENIKNCEILCVGTEILIGDIVNTNAAYISKKLAEMGISQYRQGVVGDNPARLKSAIHEALERCDLLILTGGLGPTYDDLTKETAAASLGKKLVLDEESLERIKGFFAGRGLPMPESNIKQAMMPEGAVIFRNDNGTAPGAAVEDERSGKTIIMLPGPPRELIPMFEQSAVPYLEKRTGCVFVSKNINLYGIGESAAEEKLRTLMESAENPTLAPYCSEGEVRLRVTARSDSRENGEALCDTLIEKVRKSEVGKYIYGIDTDLESEVVKKLAEKGLKAATAESCTGGLTAGAITAVPGSSEVFVGGAVSYSNDIKMSLLGVSAETLEKYGAVSEQTAREMALGAVKRFSADTAVSITGIAGPGGGSDEKPVGLVYFAAVYGDRVITAKMNYNGSRAHIRSLSVKKALSMILEVIG